MFTFSRKALSLAGAMLITAALTPAGASGTENGVRLLVHGQLHGQATENEYVQTNLVSDIMSIPAEHHDPNLQNPWGVAFFPGGPFWISDNNDGLSTLYDGSGNGIGQPFVIPLPNGSPGGAPTGIVWNDTLTGFIIPQAIAGAPKIQAIFIFATEDGTIAAWNPAFGQNAKIVIDNSQIPNAADGAVYKGLALGTNLSGNFLYATNFRAGTVDVFDSTFTQTSFGSNKFVDKMIPPGFAPFGIKNIEGNLFVTYALQNSDKHDDVAGPGNGFVDVFDTGGNLIQRFARHGTLNSPWGVALAPAGFGKFAGDVLIGNFGDGRIGAFDLETGRLEGQLRDPSGFTISIDGLWSLVFGGGLASDPNTLYFTAGPNGEKDGIFGTLLPSL